MKEKHISSADTIFKNDCNEQNCPSCFLYRGCLYEQQFSAFNEPVRNKDMFHTPESVLLMQYEKTSALTNLNKKVAG